MTVRNTLLSAVHRMFPSRRGYMWARHELQCVAIPAINALDSKFRRQREALSRMQGLSLNLGSGGRGLPGWVNVDAFRHADTSLLVDLRRPLPLRDRQVRRVYAEHVIEHIDFRDELPALLSEIHRVLERQGTLRIVVPDARRFVEAYLSGDRTRWLELGWDPEHLPSDIYTPMHVINHVFDQDGEHKFGFDYETLAMALRRAGFGEVRQQAFRQSIDPELEIDQEGHAKYSLYVDARRT